MVQCYALCSNKMTAENIIKHFDTFHRIAASHIMMSVCNDEAVHHVVPTIYYSERHSVVLTNHLRWAV